jgi:hypothetical protein
MASSPVKKIKSTDSTSYGESFKCFFKRYLLTEFGGTGIVPKASGDALLFGLAVHDGIEALLKEESLHHARWLFGERLALLEDSLTLNKRSRKNELQWIGYGLLSSFHEWTLPSLLNEFLVHSIERELIVPLGIRDSTEFWWATRPDVILERKEDQASFNLNIKSSGYIDDLATIYEFSVQMLMEAEAIRIHLGKQTVGSIILGLDKGEKRKALKSDRDLGLYEGFRQDSPFMYMWKKGSLRTKSYIPGAFKVPADSCYSTFDEFYPTLDPSVVASQVVVTPPISHPPCDVEDLKGEILTVENLVHQGFKVRNLSNCNNDGGYKKPCPYKQFCWGTPQEKEDNYIPRIPNHPIEATLKQMEDPTW